MKIVDRKIRQLSWETEDLIASCRDEAIPLEAAGAMALRELEIMSYFNAALVDSTLDDLINVDDPNTHQLKH